MIALSLYIRTYIINKACSMLRHAVIFYVIQVYILCVQICIKRMA